MKQIAAWLILWSFATFLVLPLMTGQNTYKRSLLNGLALQAFLIIGGIIVFAVTWALENI